MTYISSNNWFRPGDAPGPEDLISPWYVTSESEVTAEKVEDFLSVTGGKLPSACKDYEELASAIRTAWKGHLVDRFVPRERGFVLLDNLAKFACDNWNAIACYKALSPSARPNCYLSRRGNVPGIVYGNKFLFMRNSKWTYDPDFDAKDLPPMSDFAFKRKFDDADQYLTSLRSLTDFRTVVAVDSQCVSGLMSVIRQLSSDSAVRPVVVYVGVPDAVVRTKIAALSQYAEVFVCETPGLLPICIGCNRSVLVTSDPDLCDIAASGGVKVVAYCDRQAQGEFPKAMMFAEPGAEDTITTSSLSRLFGLGRG